MELDVGFFVKRVLMVLLVPLLLKKRRKKGCLGR
jgi:hypothetical protein